MVIESLLLAVALVGMSKLVDLGFEHWKGRAVPARRGAHPAGRPWRQLSASSARGSTRRRCSDWLARAVSCSGSLRLLQTPAMPASTLAVTGSAFLFSLAHHAGTPGEAFTWFAFIFRWLAGRLFAWVFVVRGFGVAVGTHTAYDILVGWVGWHL